MSGKKIFSVNRLIRLSLLLLSVTTVTSCGGGFEPFVGVTSGKNKSYAAPVEALNYTIETVHGGSINGGCIPNTSGVEDNEIGKHRFGGGSTCGAAYLPAKWKPGMTARINWTVLPYPDWQPRGSETAPELDRSCKAFLCEIIDDLCPCQLSNFD